MHSTYLRRSAAAFIGLASTLGITLSGIAHADTPAHGPADHGEHAAPAHPAGTGSDHRPDPVGNAPQSHSPAPAHHNAPAPAPHHDAPPAFGHPLPVAHHPGPAPLPAPHGVWHNTVPAPYYWGHATPLPRYAPYAPYAPRYYYDAPRYRPAPVYVAPAAHVSARDVLVGTAIDVDDSSFTLISNGRRFRVDVANDNSREWDSVRDGDTVRASGFRSGGFIDDALVDNLSR